MATIGATKAQITPLLVESQQLHIRKQKLNQNVSLKHGFEAH